MKSRKLPLYLGAVYAFLYLPLAVMFAFSFNDARRNVVWRGATLKWYAILFHDADMLRAFMTSLKVAVLSAGLAVVLGLWAGYALARKPPRRGAGFYDSWLNMPLMMPEIVVGVGLLSFFTRLGLPLDFWTLVLAHAMIALPYTLANVKARFLSLGNSRLEEAAMDLGADEWTAFRRVTLPSAKPAIIAGALLAFTMSFEDFVTTFFIAGIGVVTLPLKVYSMMKFGVTPEINALSSLLLILTAAALLAQGIFLSKTRA